MLVLQREDRLPVGDRWVEIARFDANTAWFLFQELDDWLHPPMFG